MVASFRHVAGIKRAATGPMVAMTRFGTAPRAASVALALLSGCADLQKADSTEPVVSADGGPEGGECRFGGQDFWASMRPLAEETGIGPSRSGLVTGVVEAIVSADPVFPGIGSRSPSTVDGLQIRTNDDQLAELQLSLPGSAGIVQVGDTVSVRFEVVVYGYPDASSGFVEMRDVDGELLVWVSQSHEGVNSLRVPPELAIEDAEPLCTKKYICGTLTARGLVVRAGDARSELGYGDSVDVGDYTATSINTVFERDPTATCFDGTFGPSLIIAALRAR